MTHLLRLEKMKKTIESILLDANPVFVTDGIHFEMLLH